MKTRDLLSKGFKPMLDKKGRTRLVLPALELDPELTAEMGDAQIDAAVYAAAKKLAQKYETRPAPVAGEKSV